MLIWFWVLFLFFPTIFFCCCCLVSESTLLWPPWTIAHQAPLSMVFPRQEYWSGLPFPSPGDFPDPGVEPVSAALASVFFTTQPLVKVIQSCMTLWDPMEYTVHGILQARILEWVAFPFSRGSSQPRDRTQVSHIAGRYFFFLIYFYFLFFYFFLIFLFVVDFVIHWNETAMGLHVFPIPIPPPTSLS